ncbi:MAG: guanylate kinase [Fimbriimonadales bacterium]
MRGLIVILSGPSGVGKDTVITEWQKRNPDVRRVVTCTTRQPRPGERDGVDYTFLDTLEFQKRAASGELLEFKSVHGNFYGAPAGETDELVKNRLIAVLKIDVQGGATVKAARPEALTIFLAPPSWEELERRIRERATDSEEAIRLRLENARREMEASAHYEHVVVNDDLQRAVAEVDAIVTEARSSRGD